MIQYKDKSAVSLSRHSHRQAMRQVMVSLAWSYYIYTYNTVYNITQKSLNGCLILMCHTDDINKK